MSDTNPGTGVPGKPHQIAFVFDDEAYTFSDVLIAGALRREWAPLVRRAQALDRVASAGLGIAGSQAAASVQGFRRAHRLEAASDLRDWLSARDLTADDLICYARAAESRQADLAESAERAGAGRWWAQAVFSGAASTWANALQRWVAASHARPPGGQGAAGTDDVAAARHARQVAVLSSAVSDSGVLAVATAADQARVRHLIEAYLAYRSWARAAIDEPATDQLIGRQRIAWTWLEYDEIVFSSDAMAREAAECVAEDDEPIEDLAARADAVIIRQARRRESLSPQEDSVLMALQAGQVGGPVRSKHPGGEPALLRLRRTLVPVPADEPVRRLARAELIDATLSNAAAERIRRAGAW
jgi:hypothetical protein